MHTNFCIAPFNALLVDVDKNISPCRSYRGESWGEITSSSNIDLMLKSSNRSTLQQQFNNDTIPEQCLGCFKNLNTRSIINSAGHHNNQKIRFLEWTSSYECNLACVMCGERWSSSWHKLKQQHGWPIYRTGLPNNHTIAQTILDQLDLSDLQILYCRGGEPFLNTEIELVLEYLLAIGQLQYVSVCFESNVTVISNRILELLALAQEFKLMYSIDAAEELNSWIRYSPNNPKLTSTNNYIENINRCLELPNITHIENLVTISAYNIWRLDEHWQWYQNFKEKLYAKKITKVVDPSYKFFTKGFTSITILSNTSRQQLKNQYVKLDHARWEQVINNLDSPQSNRNLSNYWRDHTNLMDSIQPVKIRNIIPEISPELDNIQKQ